MINKTKTECETKLCNYDSATRIRFYNGMLLTDEHLRAEQYYFHEALRRLTRHLFGWGVVCGLEIVEKRGLCIKVNPGIAIDCCGNLIEVCKCITLNLSKECEERYGKDCIPQTPQEPFTKYLVLRYVENETDPEPVLTPPDDCSLPDGKPSCQASKIREGYCLELWDRCPCGETETVGQQTLSAYIRERSEQYQQYVQQATKQQGQQQQQTGVAQLKNRSGHVLDLPSCSPCGCCENAVGLADLEIDCANSTVDVTYNCKRNVITPRFLDAVFSKVYNAATKSTAELHPDLAYASTANMVALAVEYERSSDRLKRLEDQVEQLSKNVTRIDRLAKKQGLPPAPK